MILGYLTIDCLLLGELWRIILGFWQTDGDCTTGAYTWIPNKVTTVIKAILELHNILTLKNNNIWNWIVEDNVQVFDGAFEYLTKPNNRPATAAAQVYTYFTEYCFSVDWAVDWQMKLHVLFKMDTLLLQKQFWYNNKHTFLLASSIVIWPIDINSQKFNNK